MQHTSGPALPTPEHMALSDAQVPPGGVLHHVGQGGILMNKRYNILRVPAAQPSAVFI
jgi:hypothetical protein